MASVRSSEIEFFPIVFTDLDGTLLDHHTYDYSPAGPALEWIADHDIPLILSSSKTRAEIADLQWRLGISCPAIVENGGGVSVPEGYFPGPDVYHSPGVRVENIQVALAECPEVLRSCFNGFCDWSVQEIADKTGLSLEAAAKAAAREWSVPGLWSGEEQDFESFRCYLKSKGIEITQGGRFTHLMGACSKGMMMSWLLERFRKKFPSKTLVSIALGDAPNDVSMLSAADHAIVIPNLNGIVMDLDASKVDGNLHYALKPGPTGWNDTLLPILKAF